MLSNIVLAITLLASVQSQDPGAGTVRGVIRSEATHSPLKYAIVQVVGGDLTQRAVTDSSGLYVLRNVASGIHAIRAEHLDHAPFVVEVLVPARAEVRVDMTLVLRPVPLPPVLAHNRLPRGGDTVAAAPPDLGAAAVRALEASPGVAELGLAANHVGAPGSDPADPSDVLYVRGAAADLKLVLLDGAPVYAPFHVGGLIDAFDPGVLRSATLYLGGAPAKYDGGLSYVMDMESRGGRRDQVRTDGSVDMLSARALVEGPITSSAGYMVTGRTVHGLGTSLLDSDFPYGYADGLARFDYDAGAHGSVRATGFWNQESVRLDHENTLASTAAWGNTAALLRYRGELAGVDAEFTAGYGAFDATLPIGGTDPVLANGLAQRFRLAADLGHGMGPLQLHYGASYDHIALRYTSRPSDGSEGNIIQQTAASGEVGGIYMDGSVQAGPRIKVRGGMRADVFSRDLSNIRFGPRLAVTFLLSDRVALTFAGGTYHQYIRASEVAVLDVDPLASDSAGSIAPLSVARATHLLIGLDQDVGEGIRVGLQGFYKTYEGLPDPTASPDSRSYSSGLDLWVRRSTGRLTGWVGYSLGWVWTVDPSELSTDKFSGRQIVSAGLTGPIGGRGKFDVRVGYGAGLPYTAIPENSGPKPAFNSGAVGSMMMADVLPVPPKDDAPPITTTPEDPYLRLDAQVARTFATEWWNISFEVTPYVRVLNALHRRDALFYQFDRTRDTQPRPLASLPVLPIVGFEWRF